MNDHDVLRAFATASAKNPHKSRRIAITGGKGGVGKSALAVNLAVAQAEAGARVLLIDADLGMADLNLFLGVAPQRSLLDVIYGLPPADALIESYGVDLLPVQSGALLELDDINRCRMRNVLDALDAHYDLMIMNVGPGIGPVQTFFSSLADDVVVVITPDSASIAATYACLKSLVHTASLETAHVLANRAPSEAAGVDAIERLSRLVDSFLGVSLKQLPVIPHDPVVSVSLDQGQPFVVSHPDTPASTAVQRVAVAFDTMPSSITPIHRPRPARRSIGYQLGHLK